MRRAVLLGAIAGLIIAIGFTLAMPSHEVTSTYIPATHGQRVPVYGALQPYAPHALTVPTVQRSPRTVRDALLGLLAGGLVAGVFVTVTRLPPRGRT